MTFSSPVPAAEFSKFAGILTLILSFFTFPRFSSPPPQILAPASITSVFKCYTTAVHQSTGFAKYTQAEDGVGSTAKVN